MSDEKAVEPLPERDWKDAARTGVEATIALVPVVGGAAAVVLENVIPSSLARRREAWLRELADVVNELADRVDGFDPEALAGNELFISGVIEASRIALGTHLEEKLKLLKNALAHLALDPERDDFLAMRFLAFVDELSPEHFIVLEYARDPMGWFDRAELPVPDVYMGAPMAILQGAALGVVGDELEIVLRDLNDRALANTGSLRTMMTADGARGAWATALGAQLLDFVTAFE